MSIKLKPRKRIRSPRNIVAISRTLPAGFLIPSHSHNTGRLIYSASGTMTVVTPGGAYVVPPTRALLVPPRTKHEVNSAGKVEQRSLDLAKTSFPRRQSACRVIAVTPLLRDIILRLTEIGPRYPPRSYAARIASLIPDEIRLAPTLPLALPIPRDPRLRRLCRILIDDPADSRSLAILAQHVGASTRTLARLFQAELAMSFIKWRQQARMMRAVALLAEGYSVTETSLEVGYASVSTFIRLFGRVFGMSPRGRQRPK